MAPKRRGGGGEAGVCTAPWTMGAEEVAAELGVDVHLGLSEGEVAARQQRFGFNELEKEPGASQDLTSHAVADVICTAARAAAYGLTLRRHTQLGAAFEQGMVPSAAAA